MKLFNSTKDDRFKDSAISVCNWVLELQGQDGSFWVNPSKSYVYAHAHCYAVEGLLYAFSELELASYGKAIDKAAVWLEGNIHNKYGGIIGTHKVDKNFHPIEEYSPRLALRAFRKFIPRREIATDASSQAARIFQYRYYRGEDKQGLEKAKKILDEVIPRVASEDVKKSALHSRLDISLGWGRKTEIVATWPVFFALQACILNNEDKNKKESVISIQHMF